MPVDERWPDRTSADAQAANLCWCSGKVERERARRVCQGEADVRAAANGIVLHELTPVQASLEEAFMELTKDSVEYRANVGASGSNTDSNTDSAAEGIAA